VKLARRIMLSWVSGSACTNPRIASRVILHSCTVTSKSQRAPRCTSLSSKYSGDVVRSWRRVRNSPGSFCFGLLNPSSTLSVNM
jgi:hypothetical protein